MNYETERQCVENYKTYPDLEQSLLDHEFQRRRVLSVVPSLLAGDVILDVGCNSGYFKAYCAPLPVTVHGVDINVELVAIARTRLDSAIEAQAERMPFADKSFDVSHVGGVLELCFDPDVVMREVARVTRRAIVGTTPHADGAWGKSRVNFHNWHARSFTRDEIVALLERYGMLTKLETVDTDVPQVWTFEVQMMPEGSAWGSIV